MTEKSIFVETQLWNVCPDAKLCRNVYPACSCWHAHVNSLFRMHLLVYLKELKQQTALNFSNQQFVLIFQLWN